MPPLVPQLIVSPSRRDRSGHDQVQEQMRYTLANTAPDSNEHRLYDTPYNRLERPMPPSARLARPTTQTLSPLSMHEEEKQDVDGGAGAGAEGVQGLGDELQHTPNAAAGEGDTADDGAFCSAALTTLLVLTALYTIYACMVITINANSAQTCPRLSTLRLHSP